MTIFWTAISGVVVYLIGQCILQFVLEPIKDFNKECGDLSYLLLFYQAQITNAHGGKKEQDEIKQMGAALISTVMRIPFYSLLMRLKIFGLPSRANVFAAAREINGIAHGMVAGNQDATSARRNTDALVRISDLLNIKTTYT